MEKDIYKHEFLEYLNSNESGNNIIFDEANSEYSPFENELIHSVSVIVDNLIEKMSEGRGISPEIHVFCVKDEIVNAFCFVTNKHYYIGIHSATYVELIRRTQILSDYLVSNEHLSYYQNKNVSDVQALLWTYAFKMILVHEYMHIILGHCDTICAERAFLWENEDGEEKLAGTLNVIALQAIEMFADEFSAIDAAWQIMMKEEDIESIKYDLLNYYLAVLLVFSIFHNYSVNDITHPKLGIRLHSIMAAVDDTIVKGLGVTDAEAQIEKIDTVIDVFMEVAQQFPRLFAYDIVTELGMGEFDKEYIDLYNAAADVVKTTNSRAIYPIDEFEKMDQSTLELLNWERDFLQNAQQSGMSYEEARELIAKMRKQMEEL
ncbi:MAG: hypothetical protein HDR21_15295 [Lachnospiraceae bacterium]|nr:hypothetical protein [Lachnospiraceae bacterium]